MAAAATDKQHAEDPAADIGEPPPTTRTGYDSSFAGTAEAAEDTAVVDAQTQTAASTARRTH